MNETEERDLLDALYYYYHNEGSRRIAIELCKALGWVGESVDNRDETASPAELMVLKKWTKRLSDPLPFASMDSTTRRAYIANALAWWKERS